MVTGDQWPLLVEALKDLISIRTHHSPFLHVHSTSSLHRLLTPVCLLAAGASPLCHFGLLSLWMGSEYEFWGCWSFSCLWRPCAGPAETHQVPHRQSVKANPVIYYT